MTDLIERQSALLKSVEAAVDDHWKTFSRAFMMPQLGSFIRRDFPDFSNIAPHGLKRLLLSHPVVNVIEYPGMSEKVGAVPLSVHVPPDARSLFRSNDNLTHSGPIFSPEFWRAFHTRPPGTGRNIIVNASSSTFRVGDSDTHVENNEVSYPILDEDIADGEESDPLQTKISSTKTMIIHWLKKHDLDEKLFIRKFKQVKFEPDAGRPKWERDISSANLARALLSLNPNDQARIMLPLDIVVKMIG